MKCLKHIISIFVWVFIGLYLLLIVAFRIPSVQGELGNLVATALSNKLGTVVHIGQIDLGFLNRLIINDALIYDQRHHEMFRSARLSVKIDILPLLKSKQIRVSSAQVFGAHIKLYKASAQAQPNFQFLLDSLSSKDTITKSPIDLRINSFIIRRSSISYDRLDKAYAHGRFTFDHIHLADISANIQLKIFRPDSIKLNVHKFTVKEKSGLAINKLTFKLDFGHHACHLKDFILKLPYSTIQIPFIEATYRYKEKSINLPSLQFRGKIGASEIATQDIHPILPTLQDIQTTVKISAFFQGNYQHLDIPSLSLTAFDNNLSFYIKGDFKKHNTSTLWNVDIKRCSIRKNALENIKEHIEKKKIKMPAAIERLDNIQLKGYARCTPLSKMDVWLDVMSSVGQAEVGVIINNDKTIKGKLHTSGLALDQLLNDKRLGNFTADILIKGNLSNSKSPTIKATGFINKCFYNGYEFSDINVDGTLNSQSIIGKLSINDPNAKIDIRGIIKKFGQSNDIKLSADIHDLCPSLLRLTNKWGNARFKAVLEADFTASNINDAIGQLILKNFEMTSSTNNYALHKLHVSTGFSEGRHFITISSDFGHAELVGRFNYATIGQSLVNFVRRQLPTAPGIPQKQKITTNDFLIRAEIYKTDWLENLLQIPLVSSRPITINGKINDFFPYFYLNCTAANIRYADQSFKDITLAVTAPENSLNCDIRGIKMMDDGSELQLFAQAKACNDRLASTLRWNNNANKTFSGIINADATFETFEGQQIAHINIKPSHINIDETQWNVSPARIDYRKNHIDIDKFEIRHNDQHLTIYGTASKSNNDTLSAELNGIDVDYVLNLINFHSVDFGGLAYGRAFVTAPFSNFGAQAQLKVNHFTFEDGRMGTLDANVEWNKTEKQIDIKAIANDGMDAMTLINGYVSPSRNFIDLGIHASGTRLDFMRSFASGFLNDIEGHAYGDINVIGPLSTINLTGQLIVDGQASVKATGCTYTLRNDTVNFIPDDILLNHASIFDRNNNKGYLSGGIHHKHLTRLTYDLKVETDNMLVYDFDSFKDNTFYGTVYGSGDIDIHGIGGELDMNVNITPHKESTFVYNVSTPDGVSRQEFIKWKDNTYTQKDTTNIPRPLFIQDTASDTYINFLVNMTPDATIKLLMDNKTNDYITLNGSGTLRATYYNKGAFNMYGTYYVNRGTYGITIQNIIKKNFQFMDGGSIVFRGNPYEAGLNLQAIYTVNGVSLADLNIGNSFSNNTIRVNCIMNITGQPAKPIVDFDLDMPTVSSDEKQMVRSVLNGEDEMNQQVLYLLGIGRFYPQGDNNSSAQTERQQSQTSLAMQSLLSGTLSSQINSVLSQVIKSNNWNFGANISTGDEGWNNAEYEGLLNGRLLNNRLLINGQFGYRDNANTANTSFIGDFDIRYLLSPNGNISIKMYNQTNDRYFTKSSLNTQGIGLILKKDFINFKDLFNRKGKYKYKRKN